MIATWVAFLLYAVVAIGLGALAARGRGRKEAAGDEEFWTAGRSLGAGSVGLSI